MTQRWIVVLDTPELAHIDDYGRFDGDPIGDYRLVVALPEEAASLMVQLFQWSRGLQRDCSDIFHTRREALQAIVKRHERDHDPLPLRYQVGPDGGYDEQYPCFQLQCDAEDQAVQCSLAADTPYVVWDALAADADVEPPIVAYVNRDSVYHQKTDQEASLNHTFVEGVVV